MRMLPFVLAAAFEATVATQLPQAHSGTDAITGVDVSHHQGVIDWRSVHDAGISFAYLKATQGSSFVDPAFSGEWSKVGIPHGAYHFYSLCADPDAQAANFLATVPADMNALPPAVDLEFGGNCPARPAPAKVCADVRRFVRRVESSMRRRMLVYVTDESIAAYGSCLPDRPIWFRSLVGGTSTRPVLVQQLDEQPQVAGIDGPVDVDAFLGDSHAFRGFREGSLTSAAGLSFIEMTSDTAGVAVSRAWPTMIETAQRWGEGVWETHDGGRSWSERKREPGKSAYVLQDGRAAWIELPPHAESPPSGDTDDVEGFLIDDLVMTSATRGYAVLGRPDCASGKTEGALWSTTSGGTAWTPSGRIDVRCAFNVLGMPGGDAGYLFWWDHGDGVPGAQSITFSGVAPRPQPVFTGRFSDSCGGYPENAGPPVFFSAKSGFLPAWTACGTGLYATRDGGTTWSPAGFVPATGDRTDGQRRVFHALDMRHAWIVGADGTLATTDDGGRTWRRGATRLPLRDVREIDFVNRTHGWALLANGVVLETNDRGDTWRTILPDLRPRR